MGSQARRRGLPRRLSPAAIALAAMLLAIACTPTTRQTAPPASPAATLAPTPLATSGATASPASADAVYAAIASQVEAIRGLQPKAEVKPVVIDAATLRSNLEADFDRDNPPAAVAASERTLKTLGLLPPSANLRQEVLDLQAGQVIGYYSPKRDELFVVSQSGAIGPTQRTTYAHEFTHQLQDQNFVLDKLQLDATDQGDRSLGRLSLVEGDAVTTQSLWMQTGLTTEELGQVFSDAADPAALAALQRAPAILRGTALFPYQEGVLFVATIMANGGFTAVDAAFGAPPDSTEQIIHPDKYLAHEAPVAIDLPADLPARLGAGWSSGETDTLGELSLRIWLSQGGASSNVADAAAAGWGGDRLMLLDGPAGSTAVALVTEWDTAADATEFAAAANTAIAGLKLSGQVGHAAGSTRVVLAIGANWAEVLADLAD